MISESPQKCGLSFLVEMRPVDLRQAVFRKIGIGFSEMPAAEKSAMGRKRGWVWCFKNQMTGVIDQYALLLCMAAPQHENDMMPVPTDGFNDGIRKLFPALLLMGSSLRFPNRQCCIQKQNTLPGPTA